MVVIDTQKYLRNSAVLAGRVHRMFWPDPMNANVANKNMVRMLFKSSNYNPSSFSCTLFQNWSKGLVFRYFGSIR